MKSIINKINLIFVHVGLIYCLPNLVLANYYTLPIDTSDSDVHYSSYFDHDDGVGSQIRYDGVTSFEYDNHRGVDFGTSGVEGKIVKAVAGGVVSLEGFEDADPSVGYGYRVGIYHDQYDHLTVYGHGTTTTTYVSVDDPVSKGETIMLSGNTGNSPDGPHLHFGVYTGDSIISANQIDPFGWDATSTDPRGNGQGFLWTTYPPSFSISSTAPTTISANTTWRGNIVVENSVTINSGVTLTIIPGTVVKIKPAKSIFVSGTLNANGRTDKPIYFTSYADDSVGGDTNGNGTSTSPAAGDWWEIKVNSGGTANISHAEIRYGAGTCCGASQAMVYNVGGNLSVSDTLISTSTRYGIYQTSGTTTANNLEIRKGYNGIYNTNGVAYIYESNIHDNTNYGFVASAGTFVVASSTFSTNAGSGSIDAGVNFSHWNNSETGTGSKGFVMAGTVSSNRVWNADPLPYVVNGTVTINTGKTLTIEPGSILKFSNSVGRFAINGNLYAEGTASSTIYFTSVFDDIVGGIRLVMARQLPLLEIGVKFRLTQVE